MPKNKTGTSYYIKNTKNYNLKKMHSKKIPSYNIPTY